MYLILTLEKDGDGKDAWILHTRQVEDLWPEPDAEAEIKLLMERDCTVKVYKAERAEIRIKLEPETS